MHLDLVGLDQRVREQLLAHLLDLRARLRGIRRVDLELDEQDPAAARAALERMCEQLLANPLIESYEIELA